MLYAQSTAKGHIRTNKIYRFTTSQNSDSLFITHSIVEDRRRSGKMKLNESEKAEIRLVEVVSAGAACKAMFWPTTGLERGSLVLYRPGVPPKGTCQHFFVRGTPPPVRNKLRKKERSWVNRESRKYQEGSHSASKRSMQSYVVCSDWLEAKKEGTLDNPSRQPLAAEFALT